MEANKILDKEISLQRFLVEEEEDGYESEDKPLWREDVEEMMNTVKKFHETLLNDENIKKIFTFPKIDFGEDSKLSEDKDDVQSLIKEVEKMDAVLKIKAAEEKKAKLSRLQAEGETRGILKELSNLMVSNAVKLNCEEFLSLINDAEKTDSEIKQTIGCPAFGKIDHEKSKKSEIHLSSSASFVERNIQLAKCGRGTLSLTDEEKLRVENLLKDIDDFSNDKEDSKKDGSSSEANKNARNNIYVGYGEWKNQIREIDQKLEEFLKSKLFRESQSKISLLNKEVGEIIEENELDKIAPTKNATSKKLPKSDKCRLKEIDRLLSNVNCISQEEITPLPQQKIDFLIQEAIQNQDESIKVEFAGKVNSEVTLSAKPSVEKIDELVNNAKMLMPKFKYRFDT